MEELGKRPRYFFFWKYINGIFVAVCIVQYKAGLFGRRIQWYCRVKGCFQEFSWEFKIMLIERQNGMTGRKTLYVVQDRKWRTMCVLKLLRQKSAQNQPREFYWKKRKVALRITVQKLLLCHHSSL